MSSWKCEPWNYTSFARNYYCWHLKASCPFTRLKGALLTSRKQELQSARKEICHIQSITGAVVYFYRQQSDFGVDHMKTYVDLNNKFMKSWLSPATEIISESHVNVAPTLAANKLIFTTRRSHTVGRWMDTVHDKRLLCTGGARRQLAVWSQWN